MNDKSAVARKPITANRRQILVGGAAVAALGVALARPATAHAATTTPLGMTSRPPVGVDPATIQRWARDTWASLVAMTDPRTGLPADNISGPLKSPKRSGYTSPTNIGGYMWSTVIARELGIITAGECRTRLTQTLTTMSRLKHHEPSGMFYNWYDEANGDVVTVWPDGGNTVYPFLSSVDNGWFAASLMVVRHAEPGVAALANSLLSKMNFGMYYNKDARPGIGGLLRGGFWDVEPLPPQGFVKGNYLGNGPDVFYTPNHYDIHVTEPRIASYIGIAHGQIPPAHYFATMRTFPDDWDWQEMKPVGEHRTYMGIDVFEGAYTYRGMHIVPSWGGDMFEALMPDLFVPEASWAPRSWGINHALTVRAQREFGLDDAKYGYWGFSPASRPGGKPPYTAWGVDAIGMDPGGAGVNKNEGGYVSDMEGTNFDAGFDGVRVGTNPTPAWGDGVVTPHAAFLAMQYEPVEAFDNLVKIESKLKAYGEGGFYDAVAVKSGRIAKRYLSLDQAMVLGAIGNVFCNNVIRRNFIKGDVQSKIKPLIGIEEFGAGVIS